MTKYVWRTDDVTPRALEGDAVSPRGMIYELCNEKTVGAETLGINVAVYGPGTSTKGHGAHTDREHAYYILNGTMTVIMDGEVHVAPTGSVVFFPRGIVHDTRNDGPGELRVLIVKSPVRSGPTPPVPVRAAKTSA